jgi:hypothetical protein
MHERSVAQPCRALGFTDIIGTKDTNHYHGPDTMATAMDSKEAIIVPREEAHLWMDR